MNITTSPNIGAHRNFLTVVHQANEIIEREAGPRSETLAWIPTGGSSTYQNRPCSWCQLQSFLASAAVPLCFFS